MLKFTSTCYRVYKHYHHNIERFYVTARIHSSRMRTTRFSGSFSCTHAAPLPRMPPLHTHTPPCHACLPLTRMPPLATHTPPGHAHPLVRCLPPYPMHASSSSCTPPHHAHPPSPRMPPFATHMPTDRHKCKNITFPPLRSRAVKLGKYRK